MIHRKLLDVTTNINLLIFVGADLLLTINVIKFVGLLIHWLKEDRSPTTDNEKEQIKCVY